MTHRTNIALACAQILFAASISCASPLEFPQKLTDRNVKIVFEVHCPWNILDGTAEQVEGTVSVAADGDPDSLRVDASAQKIDYKAGLSMAGQLVAAWLRENPPTPARFVIGKASLKCDPAAISVQSTCSGSVEGKLTIWAKEYTIDVPVELKPADKGLLLTGVKEIRWGEYGFGDPDSTLAKLKPVIDLNFSIELSTGEQTSPQGSTPTIAVGAD